MGNRWPGKLVADSSLHAVHRVLLVGETFLCGYLGGLGLGCPQDRTVPCSLFSLKFTPQRLIPNSIITQP